MNDLPIINVNIRDTEFFALIDSGAFRSLLNEDVFRELNLKNQMKQLESIRLYDVQQRELTTLGIVDYYNYDNYKRIC